jgi:hypothetical protein
MPAMDGSFPDAHFGEPAHNAGEASRNNVSQQSELERLAGFCCSEPPQDVLTALRSETLVQM